jgi:hypothetical protein
MVTKENGYFDSADARFAEFAVWQDANSDGISQPEELRSLAEVGIESINLTRRANPNAPEHAQDNVVRASSNFTRSDGTQGLVGDVGLAFVDHSATETAAPAPVQPGEVDRRATPPARSANEWADAALYARDVPVERSQAENADSMPSTFDHEQRSPAIEAAAQRPQFEALQGADDVYDRLPQVRVAPSALHSGLDSIARRRLQMIEAMASFSAEGAASLDLQPQRTIDPKTLELLTALPTTRSAA